MKPATYSEKDTRNQCYHNPRMIPFDFRYHHQQFHSFGSWHTPHQLPPILPNYSHHDIPPALEQSRCGITRKVLCCCTAIQILLYLGGFLALYGNGLTDETTNEIPSAGKKCITAGFVLTGLSLVTIFYNTVRSCYKRHHFRDS